MLPTCRPELCRAGGGADREPLAAIAEDDALARVAVLVDADARDVHLHGRTEGLRTVGQKGVSLSKTTPKPESGMVGPEPDGGEGGGEGHSIDPSHSLGVGDEGGDIAISNSSCLSSSSSSSAVAPLARLHGGWTTVVEGRFRAMTKAKPSANLVRMSARILCDLETTHWTSLSNRSSVGATETS